MERCTQSDSQAGWVLCRGARELVLALALLIVGASMTNVEPAFALTLAPQTLDDQFSAVAAEVPEFGGMFLGKRGTLQVYLTRVNPARIAAAQAAIADVFGAGVVPEGGIKALRGKFGFLQLREWYTLLRPVLSTPGVTMTDIDEAHNRLLVGLQKGNARGGVLRQLVTLKVPHKAVAFVNTGPVEPLKTLQSSIRPIEGSYEIQRRAGANTCTVCSLGFNASSGNVAGFVTASHCTQVPWGLDDSNLSTAHFFQNDCNVMNQFVGEESIDPPGFHCASSVGGLCRWSDSSFVKYNAGVTANVAILARTTGVTINWLNPNLTVDPNHPRFGIVAPPSQPSLVGLQLDKVGRTTGWSEGLIVNSCADFAWSPVSNAVVLCQDVVKAFTNAAAAEGDSGSPVFRIRPTKSTTGMSLVELYGVLWARAFGSHLYFIYSPIAGVEADLGQLDYFQACLADPNTC